MRLENRIFKSSSANSSYAQHLRDERVHMEGVLNQRFNFFSVIFGFIIASISYVKNPKQLMLVFIFGFIMELLFTMLIGRAQRRLQINMKMLDLIGGDPSSDIKNEANKGCWLNPFKYSVVKLMGYLIPIILSIILFISILFAKEIFCYFKQ